MRTGLIALALAGSSAWACSGSGAQPLSLKMRNLEPIDHNIGPIPMLVEVDGFVAVGSASGDSCAAAVELPAGLSPMAVSMVQSETGAAIGFGDFKIDAGARRSFCGSGSNHCVAFVSRVGSEGIKAGTPLKLIIEVLPDGVLDSRQMADIASQMTHTSLIVAGGITKDGTAHRHLVAFRPSDVELVFPEVAKKGH